MSISRKAARSRQLRGVRHRDHYHREMTDRTPVTGQLVCGTAAELRAMVAEATSRAEERYRQKAIAKLREAGVNVPEGEQ